MNWASASADGRVLGVCVHKQVKALLYSGREDDAHLSGVAMMLSEKAAGCLTSWLPA